MRSGMDYAKYFSMGVETGLGRANLSNMILESSMPRGMMSGASGGSSKPVGGGAPVINIHIEGDIIGDDVYIRDKIIPKIEQAAREGHSQISVAGVMHG